MILTGKARWLSGFLVNLTAILLASLLFAASFPNLLFERGLAVLAWFAYIPLFRVIRRSSIGASVFWGALYGYAAYGLFNYWLSVFHPLAGLIVGIIYLIYFALLFPLLKLALILFPRRGFILQWLIWIAYEYLRTQGFLGYSYGITGYSQWTVPPLIQIADIFGVWGVSALVVFPSVYIAAVLDDWFPSLRDRRTGTGELKPGPGRPLRRLRIFAARDYLPPGLWILAMAAALVYGFVSPADYSGVPTARIALIQHNTDPWRGGMEDYRDNYRILKRLSLEALEQEPKPDLVVWSETAFVPRIYWHTTYRDDPESYALVKELLDFLREQEVPFVIGNDDARRMVDVTGNWERVDYNAVMLFERGEITGLYRKLHLVPFTEHFPYQRQLPWVYEALRNADTHFWETGDEATVFDAGGFKFSSPICFEDTVGYLSRDFVRNGAELIVNLSNDAWSGSLPAQMQHLGMAVFRAVENRRAMVRSTASGQTCGVDPNGRVLAMAEPFTETWLTVEVPIVQPRTLYTRYGDLWAWLFVLAAGIVLLIGIFRRIIRASSKGRNQ
ncbi:MAG: apolipoprotein N-acyltransferase [Spirochaetaceae bacterium]|jgi:apolipoprotein N-acyltransferase|nr:apolipoprotein N-acyltransferase [Spirochaetaceae bacterium]